MRNNDLLVMVLTTIAILIVSYVKSVDLKKMNRNENTPTINLQRLANIFPNQGAYSPHRKYSK
ncbi:hypothetical protein [Mastigocoleus testarum]|uniref:hypothetical protein n=1 Tax=Mastigocoleus testarum TaxID=996925 RepID=UPI00041F5383|nr:hypothetical protein [Mastigocoleus testarum]